MPTKFPIEFEIEPKRVETGKHWVTLIMKNIGDTDLKKLNVELHSTDTHNLKILSNSEYVPDLKPGEQEVTPFQVKANNTTSVYATVTGLEKDSYFYWESPTISLTIGRRRAKLENLFVLSRPYSTLEKTLEIEATIRGVTESEDLELHFWVNKPSGVFKEIGKVKTKKLQPEETAKYSVEFKPDEKGKHTVYAYLYDKGRIIGKETDKVFIEEE